MYLILWWLIFLSNISNIYKWLRIWIWIWTLFEFDVNALSLFCYCFVEYVLSDSLYTILAQNSSEKHKFVISLHRMSLSLVNSTEINQGFNYLVFPSTYNEGFNCTQIVLLITWLITLQKIHCHFKQYISF